MATMVAADLEQARTYFAFTRNRLQEVTAGLTDEQARFKPAPDRWSIAEILEHLSIAHDRILTRMIDQFPQAPAPEPGRNAQVVDALILERIPDRSMKATAPEFAQPKGLVTPKEALGRILLSYQRLTEFLESTPDLREHILESAPLRFTTNGAQTTADGYQWALTAAAHDERHIKQILEVKAASNYPA
ncbi:MAG TPA: DinB family protein [Candidatus Angelobacter sp.]|nr:DinB family protein [Candidatus Angelobacter sp.]